MEAQKSNHRLFIDTSAFVAMVYEKDPSHEHYRDFLSHLGENARSVFLTTDYILDETFTLLRSRAHLSVGDIEKFWSKILTIGVRVEFITKDDFARALALTKKYNDHLLSFTDATTAATMLHQGIHSILTRDHDFLIFGFEIL